ncbi:MAG: ABC transporter permease [Candidatus Hodarchaeota archaeon]
MTFKGYVAKRAVDSVFLLIVTIIFNFFLFRIMPGDPTIALMGRQGQIRPEHRLALLERYGLDKPLHEQFMLYLENMLPNLAEGRLLPDLGISFNRYPQEVTSLIFGYRLLNTITLMGLSIVLSFIIAILLGTIAAAKFKSRTDLASILSTLTLYSTPVFWVGMLIIFIFFAMFIDIFGFNLIPLGGSPRLEDPKYANIFEWGLDYLYHMIGPLVTLTVSFIGGWFLIARDQMLGIFTEDYITTARAKGLKERRVLFVHARKNAMLPLISLLAVAMTYLVTGATMTETVFSWDGLGLLTFNSVYRQDYPVLQGLFLLLASVTILSNFIADLLYAYLDPRIRY